MKDLTDPSIQVTLTTFPDGMRKAEVRGLSIEHAKEMVTKAMEDPNQRNEHLYKIIAITIGTTFLVALLALTVFLPEPTKFQQRVLLSILALAAAGVLSAAPADARPVAASVVESAPAALTQRSGEARRRGSSPYRSGAGSCSARCTTGGAVLTDRSRPP